MMKRKKEKRKNQLNKLIQIFLNLQISKNNENKYLIKVRNGEENNSNKILVKLNKMKN